MNELRTIQPAGLRGHLRNMALDGLCKLAKPRDFQNALDAPRIQFVYIHHLFRDEEEKLDILLRELSRHYTFISYAEAVDRIVTNRIDKPYLSFSTDDGFKNNLKMAEILNRYAAKACIFICPSIIGERDFNVAERFCNQRLEFPPVEFLDWDDVGTLQKMGHEIGSHTMDHMRISEASQDSISDDMNRTHAVLVQRCGCANHFAFPFGRLSDFNELGRHACFSAGFESCASAERGCHVNSLTKPCKEDLIILRDHIVVDWKIEHILYFLSRNARKAEFQWSFAN